MATEVQTLSTQSALPVYHQAAESKHERRHFRLNVEVWFNAEIIQSIGPVW